MDQDIDQLPINIPEQNQNRNIGYKYIIESPEFVTLKIRNVKYIFNVLLTTYCILFLQFLMSQVVLDSVKLKQEIHDIEISISFFMLLLYIINKECNDSQLSIRLYNIFKIYITLAIGFILSDLITERIQYIRYELAYDFGNHFFLFCMGICLTFFILVIFDVCFHFNQNIAFPVFFIVCILIVFYSIYEYIYSDTYRPIETCILNRQFNSSEYSKFPFKNEQYIALEFEIIREGKVYYGYGCASNLSYKPYIDMNLEDPDTPWPYKFYQWENIDNSQDFDNFPFNYKLPSWNCISLEQLEYWNQHQDIMIDFYYINIKAKDYVYLMQDITSLLIGRNIVYRDDNLINFITYGCWMPLFFSDFFYRRLRQLLNYQDSKFIKWLIFTGKKKAIIQIDQRVANFTLKSCKHRFIKKEQIQYFMKREFQIASNQYMLKQTKKSKQLYILMITPYRKLAYSIHKLQSLQLYRNDIISEISKYLFHVYSKNQSQNIIKLKDNPYIEFRQQDPSDLQKFIQKKQQIHQEKQQKKSQLQERLSQFSFLSLRLQTLEEPLIEIEMANVNNPNQLQEENNNNNNNNNNFNDDDNDFEDF